MKLYIFFIRFYFRVLSAVAPAMAGRKAFRLFQRTRKLPFKEAEKRFYEVARKFEVVHPNENIHAYEFGDSEGKLAILVHGWDSNAGSMGAIAQTLAAEGFRVIAFDLPAHGNSRLTHTNLRECREAFRALIYQLRPSEPFSIVSHSFGSAVTAFALTGSKYKIENWVMLTSPNSLLDIFSDFKKQIALGDEAFEELLDQTQYILNEPVQEIQVEIKALQIQYKNLTIIHDMNDKVLPFSNSSRLSKKLPQAKLYTLKNVGHYRMLWNAEVVSTVKTELGLVKTPVDFFDAELLSA